MILFLMVSFLVYTTSFGSIPSLSTHKKLTSCLGAIKCPRIEAPLCVRVKHIAHQKPEYILVLNKCEMKYFKCYPSLDAVVVPMKACHTGNETRTLQSDALKRIKRHLRKTLDDKIGVIQFSSAHQKNEDLMKLTEWTASSIEEFEETVYFGFVVGVTKGMEDVLPYARDAIEAVLDTVSDDTSKRITDLVLSIYVWPQINGSLFLRTEDTDEFMVAVNDLHCLASQQDDNRCEQDIYQASILGLERAMPKTHMFVFANGAPTENDFYFESEVKRLAQEKDAKVNFVVTGDCGAPNERPFRSFYPVAAETQGQVLRIRKRHLTSQFLKYINHTVMEIERKVILSTVYRAKGSSQLRISFNVSEDDDIVTVTVSGENCNCAVYDNRNNTLEYAYDVTTKHVKMYKYMGLHPGTYRIQLHPNKLPYPPQDLAAPALVTVAVSRVEMLFKYGFSKRETNTLKNTEAQPRENTPLYIIIAVREPRNLVKVANMTILNMLNEVISSYNLIETSKEDVYRTKHKILIPKRKQMKIKITGSLRDTPKPKKLIERISTRTFRPFNTETTNEVTESTTTYSSSDDMTTTTTSMETTSMETTKTETTKSDGKPPKLYKGHENQTCDLYTSKQDLDLVYFICSLSCQVIESDPEPQFFWEVYPDPWEDGYQMVKQANFYGDELQWKIRRNEKGEFTDRMFECEAYNEHGKDEYTVNMHHVNNDDYGYYVAQDPKLSDPMTVTATEGDPVKIVCALSRAKNIKWSFRKKYSKEYHDLKQSGRTLLLDPVTMQDAGYYRCQSASRQSKNTHLQVLVLGRFLNELPMTYQGSCMSDYYDYVEKQVEEMKGVSNPRHWKQLSNCFMHCPARDVMVCARCQHGVHRTFLSECYMRMYQCKNPKERLELAARRPCAASAPYLGDMRRPRSRLPSPGESDDPVLRFLDERH